MRRGRRRVSSLFGSDGDEHPWKTRVGYCNASMRGSGLAFHYLLEPLHLIITIRMHVVCVENTIIIGFQIAILTSASQPDTLRIASRQFYFA